MAKKIPFRSMYKSDVRRTLPKHRFFSHMFRPKTKRHRAQVGAMDDDAPSSRIVRVLVVILLVHILVIGAVCLQGRLTKDSSSSFRAGNMSLPPSALPAVATPTMTTPPVANQAVEHSAPATAEVHITDPSTVARPDGNIGLPTAGVKAGSAVHLVTSGETWASIAAMNGCSEADLREVNPSMASYAQPVSGERLMIPAKPGEEVAVADEVSEEVTETFHELKRGETLSKVARTYKTSVQKLMMLNNLTEKDISRLAAGRKLQVTGDMPVEAPVSAAPAASVVSPPASAIRENREQDPAATHPNAPEKHQGTGIYVLKKGETLAAVARKHKTTVNELFRLNRLDNQKARRLQPGAKIKIPR